MNKIHPVLETTSYVIANAGHVEIDTKAVHRVAEMVGALPALEWDTTHHFVGDEATTATYFLVLDAMNFCFFADEGKEKWGIVHGGRNLGGYFALSTALKCAFTEDPRLADARYLATMPGVDLERILSGRGTIPLFRTRLEHVHEIGRSLLCGYHSSFPRMIRDAHGSAQKLIDLLVTHMPSFEDKAIYSDREVLFRKRAQILVGDIYGAFEGGGLGNFYDIDTLTMFADYKIPQILESFGALRYSSELCRIIDAREQIPSGDPREVEIRAASIWAVEMIKDVLCRRENKTTSLEVDWHLWTLAENKVFERPHHRTRTAAY